MWPSTFTIPVFVWLFGLAIWMRDIKDKQDRKWFLALAVAWVVAFSLDYWLA